MDDRNISTYDKSFSIDDDWHIRNFQLFMNGYYKISKVNKYCPNYDVYGIQRVADDYWFHPSKILDKNGTKRQTTPAFWSKNVANLVIKNETHLVSYYYLVVK